MSKKILLLFLIFTLLAIPTAFAIDNQQPIKVYVDGNQLTFAEQPVIENDVTLVQFRPIFEKLGLKIEWNADTQMIIGRSDSLIIKLTIGSTSAVVNDEVKTLVIAPKIVNGNTLVPLRFVSQASGKEVIWDGDNRKIWIHDLVSTNPSPTPTSSPTPTPNVTPTPTPTPIPVAFTFRKSTWGMSMDDVKKSETSEPSASSDHMLLFDSKIAGVSVRVSYSFIENKLTSVFVADFDTHSNKNLFIDDYNRFRDALTAKYGNPLSDQMVWKNDLFKGDTQYYGLAVGKGDLSYLAKWENDDSTISELLYGDNYTCKLAFSLESKKLKDLIDKQKQNNSSSEL